MARASQSCAGKLDKFEIADLDHRAATTSYEKQGEHDDFYLELKSKVQRYFKDHNVRISHNHAHLHKQCIVM